MTKFTADRYTPTEFDTAADKAKFANHFVRFVESGFKPTLFPKWFYNRLSMTFGHIAHYNQGGFYEAQCSSTAARLRFLRQTVEYPCYGSPTHTYCDVERDLSRWVSENGLIDQYRAKLASEQEQSERSTLAALKAKYESA